jgi:cobalt-zinc-cadmium efflux system outer membrane protein
MNWSIGGNSGKSSIPPVCLVLGMAFFALPDARAENMDAETAVRLAVEQADVRAVEQAGIDIASSALTAASAWPNPELHLSQERGRGALSGSDETSLMLSQTWDVSGNRGLARQAAELGVRAAEAEVLAARVSIRAEVLRQFHDAIAADARATAAAEQAAALDRLANLAARRTEAGDLSGFEAQRIAHVAQRARLQLDEREAERLASRERLAAWVGQRARADSLQPDAIALPIELPPPGAALNPDVIALQRRVDAAEAAEQAALRWRMPVSIGIGQKRVDTPGGHDQALLLEAAIPLPLFERNQAGAQQSRAEAELARAKLAAAGRQLEGRRAAALLIARQLASSALSYSDQVIPRARRLSQIATRSFADGEIDLVGLLETLDGEAAAVEQSIDLHYRARVALVELESLTLGDPP